MKFKRSEIGIWKALFFSLILGYCLLYSPFGVNETDGGFLSGLAWQVLNGKVLYRDIIYVRPPLPVWLRAMEIQCLPVQVEVLGERWIFYIKLGLYNLLAASLLYRGESRWKLAIFGFIVSANCYPPMAWHTVDGILFATLSVYFFFETRAGIRRRLYPVLSGLCLLAAILCKQSFYPLGIIFPILFTVLSPRKGLLALASFILSGLVFSGYLIENGLLDGFVNMTAGASDGGRAFEHAVLDYFRITPELALPSIVWLALLLWLYRKNRLPQWQLRLWMAWLFALVFSYAAVTWMRQEQTTPIAQIRALFWVAFLFILQGLWQIRGHFRRLDRAQPVTAMLLLGIGWCAAISWGYNFPILFATPLVWGAMECTAQLQKQVPAYAYHKLVSYLLLAVLLLAFRLGYEFVYRDGSRSEMTEHMGVIFPKLSGIYSDAETAARYRDLKRLVASYGPDFAVLPAFPQAHYLTDIAPSLPLDWVVERETNGDNRLIFKKISEKKPVLFFEKNYLERLKTDPELSVSRSLFEASSLLEETAYFQVRH